MATSLKRANDANDREPLKKIAKVHPFFSKPGQTESSSTATFEWLKPIRKTCLHGVSIKPPPKNSTKVAAFDLDGTVIKSRFKMEYVPLKWDWWDTVKVPAKLVELHESGYSVIFVSNQSRLIGKKLTEWKAKVGLIAAALPEIPLRTFAATEKDAFRKPLPGIWNELERIFAEDGVQIDKSASFFVGDAAGRTGDFSDTDRKWAINVGVPFYTPEEYFHQAPAAPFVLKGLDVSKLSQLPPSPSPIIPSLASLPTSSSPNPLETVLLVGYPCLGKSTFYSQHFSGAGYVHVNQDILGTRPRCVKAVEEALSEGKSCVVDNTNRDVATRKYYIDVAKQHGATVRCFVFEGDIELAWHNNLYRALILPTSKSSNGPARQLLPASAFTSFRFSYEQPTLEEGLASVESVQWAFEGDEEARKRWGMWLQIDDRGFGGGESKAGGKGGKDKAKAEKVSKAKAKAKK